MSSTKIVSLIFCLFVKIVYDVCMTIYVGSYDQGEQLSLAYLGRFAHWARQGKLFTQSQS